MVTLEAWGEGCELRCKIREGRISRECEGTQESEVQRHSTTHEQSAHLPINVTS